MVLMRLHMDIEMEDGKVEECENGMFGIEALRVLECAQKRTHGARRETCG